MGFKPIAVSQLAPPGGDGRSVWCSADGVFIGPNIALVEREYDELGCCKLVPMAVDHLNKVLTSGYGEPFDAAPYLPGLGKIADALNKGDLALANIALVQLCIPPFASAGNSQLAAAADDLQKVIPWDPVKHPRRSTSDAEGHGGEFVAVADEKSERPPVRPGDKSSDLKPTDEPALDTDALTPEDEAHNAWKQFGTRSRALARAIAPLLSKIPRYGQLIRALAEALPALIEEFPNIRSALDPPRTMDELRLAEEDLGFSSFEALKKSDDAESQEHARPEVEIVAKVYRPDGARPGYQLHHIVEQNPANSEEFTPEQLHSTENVIEVPVYKHEAITAYYNSKPDGPGTLTVRQQLRGKSYEEQREKGLEILRKFGVLQP
jgi:hypothetical protein